MNDFETQTPPVEPAAEPPQTPPVTSEPAPSDFAAAPLAPEAEPASAPSAFSPEPVPGQPDFPPEEPTAPETPPLPPTDDVPPAVTVDLDPVTGTTDARKSKHGLAVFLVCIGVTIALALSCTVGYLAGRHRVTAPAGSMQLESRPQDVDPFSTQELYNAVSPSVVGIAVYNESASVGASGVIYTKDGYVITNDHIYDGVAAPKFLVFPSDGKSHEATYVAGDTRSDLAVLKIKEGSYQPAKFGDSAQLVIGESVAAIGRPNGASSVSSITRGIISLCNRRVTVTSNYSVNLIQTDAAINPGSSGGALVNQYGQVVGITSSKLSGDEYDRIGFAIPTATVSRVVDSLIRNGYVADRARLGITYREIDAVAAAVNEMPQGILIASVEKESELYNVVKENDIITEVNGEPLTDANVILDLIEASKPGDVITVTVVSGDRTFTAQAHLLADAGSSSYQKEASKAPSASDDTSSYTTSEFDFPFGY